MRYIVTVLPKADADVDGIYLRLKKNSPQGAISWYEAYNDALVDLSEDPERWPDAGLGPVHGRRIHEMLFRTRKGRRYRMLYSIVGNRVEVMHVQSPGQDEPEF